MKTQPRRPLRHVLGGASVASLLTLAACGGTESDPAAAGKKAPADDPGPFCGTVVDIDTAIASGPGSGPPPKDPAEAREAIAAFSAKLKPLLAKAEKNAPKVVAEDVQTLARTSRQALRTGDPSAFGSPQFRQADGNVDRWMVDNCGYHRMNVTAVDHEFQGLPKKIAAGPVALTLTNKGTDVHELVLLRINDGVTHSIDHLLTLPEQEAMRMVKPAGATAVPPGRSETVFFDVKRGRYGVVCFIPTGTTSRQHEGNGPPHFVEGMAAELTVS